MSLKFILKNQAYTLPSPWNLLDLNPSWISYSLFLLWNQLHWCIIFYNKIHPVLSVLKNSIVKWKNKTQEYTLYDSIYKRITKILKIQCSLRSAFNHYQNDNPQPSRPLLFPSPPAFSLSQHQGLFQRVSSLHQVAKVLELQLQHQSFQWTFRIDFL